MPMRTREEQRHYQKEWIQKRRQEWIDANGPCARCSSWNELTVDHKDNRIKVLAVASVWSMSRTNPKRVAELAKCWVLCRACHVKKTKEQDHIPHPFGVEHSQARLTELDVLKIRELRATGLTQASIATMFDIGRSTVEHICNGRTWRHL